jgi:hypothetical protein
MQPQAFALLMTLLTTVYAVPNPLQIALSLDLKNANALGESICLMIYYYDKPRCASGWVMIRYSYNIVILLNNIDSMRRRWETAGHAAEICHHQNLVQRAAIP